MTISDLGLRIADRLLIAGCLIGLAGCNQTRVAEAPTAEKPAIDVVELSATEARDRMAAGQLTSEALTRAYLDRIAQVDDAGPTLDAVIELNPQAVSDAAALDAERKAGKTRGPMHGIPVLIKDNIDIAGLVNSAGSLALADNRPAADAFLVKRVRDAGAVILGKTNLSEWANFRSTRSSSGWSSRGGQTKNPYVLDRNPCGSSSGTGSAIAASLAAVGVGTETDGSIICPSSVNGLAGLKPTVGLVSRSGIIPISVSQDTAGPMARTVSDVALLLTAMAGVDPADPSGPAATGKIATDYTTFLKGDALRGRRFGVLRQAMGYHPDVDASTMKAIDAMTAAGAELIDVKVPAYNDWNDPEFSVLLYEFKDGLNAYLKKSGSQHASLEALIAWNKANAKQVMPIFGQEIFEQAQAKGPLTDGSYLKARDTARRLAGKDGLIGTLDRHKLDALIAPSLSPAWPTDHVLGDHFVGAGYGMAAVAGTPSLTVAIGDSHGLPLGLTFMGRAYSEGELIGFGFAVEQAMKARRAPQYQATLTVR
jgi:amidase